MLGLGFQRVKLNLKYKFILLILLFIIIIYLFLSIFTSVQAFKINDEISGLNPSIYEIKYEEVFFSNNNNIMLSGWWVENNKKNKSETIILLHGLRSNKSEKYYIDLLKEFYELGYSIFTFDFRNHGESEQGKFSFGDDEVDDLVSALKYLNKSKKINDFAIWGFSYGATTASIFNLSNVNLDNEIKILGVIADTPYYDPLEVLTDEVSKRTPLNPFFSGLLEPGIIFFSQILYDLDLKNIKKIFDSKSNTISPTLIFGCDKDKTVPKTHPVRVNESLGLSSNYLEFKNCLNHGDAFIYNKDMYMNEIDNFLRKQIKHGQ